MDEKMTIKSIRDLIERKFPALEKQPYVLRFQPTDGSHSAPRRV
jgi:hypothetical protein